jgi:hypothetical protein
MRHSPIRLCVLASAFLALSGCGLPPALSIAFNGMDGLSLLASGKSISDHAISQVAGEDCAMYRFVTDPENVCRANPAQSPDETIAEAPGETRRDLGR